LSLTKHA